VACQRKIAALAPLRGSGEAVAMLPALTTSRLTLRAASETDLDALWRLLTDPQVRRYLCDNRVLTRGEVQTMLEDIAHGPAGMGFWLLHDNANQMIGCVGLHPVLPDVVAHAPDLAGEIEPTIAPAPNHWGRGLAAEALAAALAYAFDSLGLDRLVAVVDEPNERSHRLMLRVGFTPTGTTATGPCYPLRTYRLACAAFQAPSAPPQP
jgi:[ribosomal protein S5]-alanine N-acetyltransferase